MTATKRKPSATTVRSKPKSELSELSPWVQKLNRMVEPLHGKLTKAISQK